MAYDYQRLSSIYQKHLGRKPDVSGAGYWRDQYESGSVNWDDIEHSVSTSEDAQKYARQNLNSIYQNYMGRDADDDGANYWLGQLGNIGWDDIEWSIQQSDDAREYARQQQAPRPTPTPAPSTPSSQNQVSLGDVIGIMGAGGRVVRSEDAQAWVRRINSGQATLVDLRRSLQGSGSSPSAPTPPPSAPPPPPSTSVSEGQTASGQLDQILADDSPLMQRAATQGQQFANQRGLLNSSMAASASQGAMIDRATPIAQQNAQTYFQNAQANADRQQQAYMANLNYQNMLGLNEQGYGHDVGRMGLQNQYALEQMDRGYQQQRDISEQQYGFDMNRLQASSTANAWGVMSNNITDIVAQSMDAINNIQANPNITAENKASMIEQILDMRDTDIAFQSSLYESLSGYLANTGLFPNL